MNAKIDKRLERNAWTPTENGKYSHPTGAELMQVGKGRWEVRYRGTVVPVLLLGGFDHADAVLLSLGLRQTRPLDPNDVADAMEIVGHSRCTVTLRPVGEVFPSGEHRVLPDLEVDLWGECRIGGMKIARLVERFEGVAYELRLGSKGETTLVVLNARRFA